MAQPTREQVQEYQRIVASIPYHVIKFPLVYSHVPFINEFMIGAVANQLQVLLLADDVFPNCYILAGLRLDPITTEPIITEITEDLIKKILSVDAFKVLDASHLNEVASDDDAVRVVMNVSQHDYRRFQNTRLLAKWKAEKAIAEDQSYPCDKCGKPIIDMDTMKYKESFVGFITVKMSLFCSEECQK